MSIMKTMPSWAGGGSRSSGQGLQPQQSIYEARPPPDSVRVARAPAPGVERTRSPLVRAKVSAPLFPDRDSGSKTADLIAEGGTMWSALGRGATHRRHSLHSGRRPPVEHLNTMLFPGTTVLKVENAAFITEASRASTTGAHGPAQLGSSPGPEHAENHANGRGQPACLATACRVRGRSERSYHRVVEDQGDCVPLAYLIADTPVVPGRLTILVRRTGLSLVVNMYP